MRTATVDRSTTVRTQTAAARSTVAETKTAARSLPAGRDGTPSLRRRARIAAVERRAMPAAAVVDSPGPNVLITLITRRGRRHVGAPQIHTLIHTLGPNLI